MSSSTIQFLSASIKDAAVITTSTVLDYEIYSQDLFDGRLYLGGWLTPAEIGPDRLYVSSPDADQPQELKWTGPKPYSLYHLNDPSVVREDNGSLAMFMTALSNAYGYSAEMTSRNITGLATSIDNGATWTWQGIVIGQQNGIDATGAWAPSALTHAGGIAVWYNTGWMDTNTNIVQPIRILKSEMDASGTHVLSTQQCVRSDGVAFSGENVDVSQAADGTYWLVANDYSTADGVTGKIIAFRSADGITWTPWSTSGPTLLAPTGNTVLMTPTISSITGNTLNLRYSEQVGAQATVERSLTVNVSAQPSVARFGEENVFNGIATATLEVAGEAYSGPVSYLQNQLIYTGQANVNLYARNANSFLHGGSGDDALVAISGRNVLDGGTGSNFLTGGTGQDVFFVVASKGADTWTTVNDFKAGDEITFWDVVPSMTDMQWHAGQGAVNAPGATLHIPEGAGHFTSLTLARWGADAAHALAANFGSIDGRSYLHLTT